MLSLADSESLPREEFAFPGALRDRLVGAIMDGTKTSTTSLLEGYAREGEPLPTVGGRGVVIDSAGDEVCIIENDEVRLVALSDVDEEHVRGEGESYASVAEWRHGHEDFWRGAEYAAAMGDPSYRVRDDSVVVLVRFRVVAS
jgi:uncharacterized protein YhfF